MSEAMAAAPGLTRRALARVRARGRGALGPVALALMLAFPFPHFEILRSPNELSRLYQVRALVDDGTLAVNAEVARFGPMGDLSQARGRLFPNKAPGLSFLGAPIYFVLERLRGGAGRVPNRALLYFLRLILCALPTLLVLQPLRRYAARMSGDARAADAAVLTYAFGSLALTYSLLFFSHQLSANLAIGSFLAFERARGKQRGSLEVLGGALAGMAVVAEYTLAPVAVMLALYAVAVSRSRLATLGRVALGAVPFALFLGWYQDAAFGSPFALSYEFVQNRTFAAWHAQGFMGLTWPKASSLAGNLFSPGRGLFAFSPAMLVALVGLKLFVRESPAEGLVAVGVTAFYFFVAASFLYQAWGWMLGPRHLTPLMPFLVAPLACVVALLRRRAPRSPGWNVATGAVAGLCAASILVTGFCTAVYPHIPDEFSAALAHLVWPLAKSGHLPYNLLEIALGRVAPWTWIPWFLGLGAIALAVAARIVERPRWWPSIAVGAVTLTAFVALLFLAAPRESAQEKQTRAWIIRTWEPGPANVRRGLF